MAYNNSKNHGKQKLQKMDGIGVTAFNMDEEKDDGHFDQDGHFIWKNEEQRVQEDAWLDDISEVQIGKAKKAKERKEERDELGFDTMNEDTANQTLYQLLQPRETVLQALKRLGPKKQARKVGKKRKINEIEQQNKDKDSNSIQMAENKKEFELITEAADYLMRMGVVDVYSQMKNEFLSDEQLLQERKQQRDREMKEREIEEKITNSNSQQLQSKEQMWEYKGKDGQIHGPYPTSHFLAWIQQGYFKGENAVDVRRIKTNDKDKVDMKQEGHKKEQLSAEEELMKDFEDSDEGEESDSAQDNEQNKSSTNDNEWVLSDIVNFQDFT